MSDIKQAYRILGLESDASFKKVMEAHRDLAVVWDPRLHENHPRLHRKATENLARVNQAFQLIRRHHLGAQIEPEEELEEPVEQAGAESEERESSLYEEIFSDRAAEAERKMPIGKIVFAVLALMIVLTYWSGSREGDQTSNSAEQTPQGTEGLLAVEIKNGSVKISSQEPAAAETTGESAPPASSSSEPVIVPRLKKEPTPQPETKSPSPVDAPKREAPSWSRTLLSRTASRFCNGRHLHRTRRPRVPPLQRLRHRSVPKRPSSCSRTSQLWLKC